MVEKLETNRQVAKERLAEDIAYVTNHALSCALTDTLVQPPVGAFVQTRVENGKMPRWLAWIGQAFDAHGREHDHAHEEGHAHKTGFLSNAKHWFLGEAVGDVGAVPLTVVTAHAFPGLVEGMRKLLEPLAGKYFHKGAHRDAGQWASAHGLNPAGSEAKVHETLLYEREMRRLPLAVIWNAFSIPINLITQRISGNKASLGTLALGKAFGALFSNSLLIGGRAAFPETFGAWDKFNSDHFIKPATEGTLEALDVDKNTANRIVKEPAELGGASWVKRSERDMEPTYQVNGR